MILSDDFTPMDFVVGMLIRFFGRTVEDATKIMMDVHTHGVAAANIYTFEICEAKIADVSVIARRHQIPLRLTIEPELPE